MIFSEDWRERESATIRMEEMSESEAERDTLLKAILELLVSAGYSRARESSVSAFDKVSGGLAWCIAATNSSVTDLDDVISSDQTQVLLSIFSIWSITGSHRLLLWGLFGWGETLWRNFPRILTVVLPIKTDPNVLFILCRWHYCKYLLFFARLFHTLRWIFWCFHWNVVFGCFPKLGGNFVSVWMESTVYFSVDGHCGHVLFPSVYKCV